ncbi:MAG TPA: hypothetical protein ENN72_02515 [Firmicutes bacterium]|nr:hypothetical protein [Bacillota bacterium]
MQSLILFPSGNSIKALAFDKGFQYLSQTAVFDYNGSVTDGMNRLMDQFKVKSYNDIAFIAPFNESFVKTLAVNKVEKKYLRQIIINEYEDILQLKDDNFIWDFDVVDDMGEEKEHIIVSGVKRKFIERWIPQLIMNKMEPTVILPEQISLLNGHFNYSGYSPVIFVDLGRKNSNIIIYDKEKDFFQMDVPVGGNDMIRNIKDICGVEWDEAESILKGEKEVPQGPGRFKVIAPVLDQIIYEVKRALIFYENRFKAAVFHQINISGGVSSIPDVAWYMNYELGIRVVKNDYFALVKKSPDMLSSSLLKDSFGIFSCMVGGMFIS